MSTVELLLWCRCNGVDEVGSNGSLGIAGSSGVNQFQSHLFAPMILQMHSVAPSIAQVSNMNELWSPPMR